MRFARQCSIFRGPVDPAPLVGVLFLLVIFMLAASLLYTPGVLVKTDGDAGGAIFVTRDGNVIFNGQTNDAAHLDQLRSGDLKAATNQTFHLVVEPGASADLVDKVRELFQVELPSAPSSYLSGTDNPTVIVAVTFRGQFFYENRPVEDSELRNELEQRVAEVARSSKKLTLIVRADKAAAYEVIMRLYRLARGVGVTEFLLAERPNDFVASSNPSSP